MTWPLRRLVPSTVMMLALWLGAAPVEARDHRPNPDDYYEIEQTLLEAGFRSWREVEFDDGLWEVDDAVGPNGRRYDVKIDPRTFRILEVDD